jgi:hypothetical protein
MNRWSFVVVSFTAVLAFAAAPAAVRLGTFEDRGQSLLGHHYEIDVASGRARLVLELVLPTQGDEPSRSELVPTVQGLSYDAASHQVRWVHEGQTTVCANLTRESALGTAWHSVEATGHCAVTTTRRHAAKDDGFTVTQAPVQDFDLVAR